MGNWLTPRELDKINANGGEIWIVFLSSQLYPKHAVMIMSKLVYVGAFRRSEKPLPESMMFLIIGAYMYTFCCHISAAEKRATFPFCLYDCPTYPWSSREPSHKIRHGPPCTSIHDSPGRTQVGPHVGPMNFAIWVCIAWVNLRHWSWQYSDRMRRSSSSA